MNDKPINFTRGVPAEESFPMEQVAECATAVVTGPVGKQVMQYGPSYGFLPLREWLADRHAVQVEQVMTANGSLQFLDFMGLALFKPGDLVMVESPTYDRALTLLRRHGARIQGIPLQADGPDLDVLDAALKREVPKLVYVIADFQNPSGATASVAKRERIVELARQYGFWVVEDAPYRPLRYSGTQLPSLLDLAPDRVLQMSSFTKQITPGLRVGYLVGDAALLKRLAKAAEDTYITPNLLGAATVYEFCRRGLLDPQLERLRNLYGSRLDAICGAIREFLPDAEWIEPQGGFFLSVNLPPGVTSAALSSEGAKLGLQLTDGRGFFPNPTDGERFLRLPFCALKPEEIREGVRRVALAVERVTGSVPA